MFKNYKEAVWNLADTHCTEARCTLGSHMQDLIIKLSTSQNILLVPYMHTHIK